MSDLQQIEAQQHQPAEVETSKKKQIMRSDILAMVVSGLCAVLIVIILYSLIMHFVGGDVHDNLPDLNMTRSFTIDHKANTFLMDGRPFRYVSGSFHYFRAVQEAWSKRFRTMKAAGLNVIDTYVEWSLHNPYEEVYTWTEMADLVKFIDMAQNHGFYVILRPGPYICAERDNGGIPHWLFTKYPGIKLRTSDANYLHEVAKWYSKLMPRLKRFWYGNGGPIIMVQVENEYGSFEACDRDYLNWLRDETQKYVDDKALLFTTDIPDRRIKCGKIEGVFATIDFGLDRIHKIDKVWRILRSVQPTGPLVNSEFYPGWLTHWQEPNQRRDAEQVADALRKILYYNASVNIYMFFGGTNFGFTAGANDFGDFKYVPDITSYDYDAVMDEPGNVTEKFVLVREVIADFFIVPNISVVKEVPCEYGRVKVRPVFDLLSNEGRIIVGNGPAVSSKRPKTFEELNQHSGLVLYETNLLGIDTKDCVLTINDLRDRALVYVDRKLVGILSRQNGAYSLNLGETVGSKLQILVENQGRINFNVANDTKGILGAVTLENPNSAKTILLEDWLNTGYPLEEPNISNLLNNIYNNSTNFAFEANKPRRLLNGPIVYYGEFRIREAHHTFLNPTGWGKGVVFINTFNLGRYWPTAGPQLTLYVPGEILCVGFNSLVIIEYEQTNDGLEPFMSFDHRPQLVI